jgi:hypothetical protein
MLDAAMIDISNPQIQLCQYRIWSDLTWSVIGSIARATERCGGSQADYKFASNIYQFF